MRRVTFTSTGINQKEPGLINRPFSIPPEITGEYTEDGKRYYNTSSGKTYDADMYDQNYKSRISKVKRKGYKGRPASLDKAGIKICKGIKRYANG